MFGGPTPDAHSHVQGPEKRESSEDRISREAAGLSQFSQYCPFPATILLLGTLLHRHRLDIIMGDLLLVLSANLVQRWLFSCRIDSAGRIRGCQSVFSTDEYLLGRCCSGCTHISHGIGSRTERGQAIDV